MLDHVFTDAISALRDAFEAAFLERHIGNLQLQLGRAGGIPRESTSGQGLS